VYIKCKLANPFEKRLILTSFCLKNDEKRQPAATSGENIKTKIDKNNFNELKRYLHKDVRII
jgi:hypothetical protein